MKALLISPSSAPGGAERVFASLARHLPHHGIDCKAILLQPGPLEHWLADAGCSTEIIDAGRTRHLHRTATVVAKLARRARDADVVLSNQSKGHVYGGAAAIFAGRPAIWWQHGTPGRSRIEIAAAKVPTAAIIVGSGASLEAQRRLTPDQRLELIHPGVDLSAVRQAGDSGIHLREQHAWGEAPLVGIVGRLQPGKGQVDFLRAAAAVADRHPEAKFVVVGGAVLGWEGDYPRALKALANELGIHDRVAFVGHQEDPYPWFDALDVVVHASHGESFGLVLAEAMALSKAVVATVAGDPVGIIEDGVSGCSVRTGDHEAIADAISNLLADKDSRHRVGGAAAVRAERFDDAHMAKHVAQLLHEVAGPMCVANSDLSPALVERSVPELHQHVFDQVVSELPRGAALDLGAGSGVFAERLAQRGHEVLAADLNPSGFQSTIPFETVDLNALDWPGRLGLEKWSLITAIEVIEHLENPIGFLRDLARLLTPDGVAIVTTPNVDSLPARLKFLLRGRIRMLDEWGDPTHISPIFWDLLNRQYLPLAGLRLARATTYPDDGFIAGRPLYKAMLRALRPMIVRWDHLLGDNHILVLERAIASSPSTLVARCR